MIGFLLICFLAAGAILLIGAGIVGSAQPPDIRGLTMKAAADYMASDAFRDRVDEIHRERLALVPMDARLSQVGFIWCMALRLYEAGCKDWLLCKKTASDTLAEYLADEKLRYGEKPEVFGWDRAGAIEIADAYQIEHWEVA